MSYVRRTHGECGLAGAFFRRVEIVGTVKASSL